LTTSINPIPLDPARKVEDPIQQREKLRKACSDFEALLMSQMLKQMRPAESEESVGLSLGKGNPLQDIFDWELARLLGQRSPLGIAESLMKQFDASHPDATGTKLDNSQLNDIISRVAGEQKLPPALVKAVIACESGGDTTAVSPKGAKGLMQLIDSTAAAVGVSDPFDPEQNIRGGASYLRQMLDRYDGDLERSLAAYNAGPGAVDRYQGIPPYAETQQYVERVMGRYLKEINQSEAAPKQETNED
jgi:Rod binding domain-containing protein